jgi:CheY-like chemotaxis protein
MLISDQLTDLGYEVVGPAGAIDEAHRLTNEGSFDAALVDVNLNGVSSHDIADALSRRKIPFGFVTGYNELPRSFDSGIILHKPFQLHRTVKDILAQS